MLDMTVVDSLQEQELFDTEKRWPKAIKRFPGHPDANGVFQQLNKFHISRPEHFKALWHFGSSPEFCSRISTILDQFQNAFKEMWHDFFLQEGCLCHPSFISLNLDGPPPLLLPLHHFCPHTFLHLHQDLRLGELYCIELSDLLKQFFTHIFAPSLECTTLHKTYLCWETILGNDLQVQPLERHLQVWP